MCDELHGLRKIAIILHARSRTRTGGCDRSCDGSSSGRLGDALVFGHGGRCACLAANRRVASGCEPRVAGAPLSAVAWLALAFFAATGKSPIEVGNRCRMFP